MRTLLAWVIALPFVAWAVARGLGLERGYPAVALAAFTPYVAPGAVLAALVATGLRRPLPAMLALLAAAALAVAVAPRAIGDGEDATARRPLRVLSANVYAGHTPPKALEAIVRRERVDVLSVQELTPGFDAAIREILPYRAVRPAPGAGGTGLYARFPLDLAPAPPARHEIAVASGALPGGGTVELTAVHPPAPTTDAAIDEWERELGDMPPALGAPRSVRLLIGDFNATLDHRAFREVLERGYVDAAERTGDGLRPTWPDDRRFPPGVTIDHVLVDSRCRVTRTRVLDLPSTDHRAVLAELDLAPCL